MKIWFFSDLHLDARDRTPLAIPEADLVVVAGDVCDGLVQAVEWAGATLRPHLPVVLVAGNADLHGGPWSRQIEHARQAAERLNVNLLEEDTLLFNGVAISGCTLWTDYELLGRNTRARAMKVAAAAMQEHRSTPTSPNPVRCLSPAEAAAIHRGSLEFLQDAADTTMIRVFVTHHAPSGRSIHPDRPGTLLDAASASDLDAWIARSGPELWIHGHVHTGSDYRIGNTRIVCNPRGRDPRNPAFDPGLVIDLPVRTPARAPVQRPQLVADEHTVMLPVHFDDMVSDIDPEPDAFPDTQATRPRASVHLLAKHALQASITKADRRRIAQDAPVAVIVKVPSADWVEPVMNAMDDIGIWSNVVARDGSSRLDDKPTRGNSRVAKELASGGSVLGISQAPELYLPSALVTVADLRIDIAPPSTTVLSKVIREATGVRPRNMPAGVGIGLDHDEICAAIRPGSARACVERLAAASAFKAVYDPTLKDAVPFDQLAGFGAAGDWGARLIEDVQAIRDARLSWSSVSRYMVMSSLPGLGKTSYVRSLAKSARLPLVATSVASWFASSNGYLDGVIKAADAAFAAAAASRSGAILFLDELDALPNRTSMSSRAAEWWTPCVTHILLQIELLPTTAPHVVVIGATNHAAKLDPALVRPGRLHPVFHIDHPNVNALAVILRQHLGDDLPDLDLSTAAELGLGGTGADVAGWVRQAKARARAADRPLVPSDLILQIAPRDHRSPETLWRAALHESAHAAVVDKLIGRVDQINLVVRGDKGGMMHAESHVQGTPTRSELENIVVGVLAGRAAEVVFLGQASSGSGGSPASDLAIATDLLVSVHATYGLGATLAYRSPTERNGTGLGRDPRLTRAVEADLVRLHARAEAFVHDHRDAIARVAKRLMVDRALSGDVVRALLAGEDEPRHAEPM